MAVFVQATVIHTTEGIAGKSMDIHQHLRYARPRLVENLNRVELNRVALLLGTGASQIDDRNRVGSVVEASAWSRRHGLVEDVGTEFGPALAHVEGTRTSNAVGRSHRSVGASEEEATATRDVEVKATAVFFDLTHRGALQP